MSDLVIRPAKAADLSAIVALLADDPLGATRETPQDLAPYREVFARIVDDPRELLIVAVHGERVVGTLQLSILLGLSRTGMSRGLIEGVRVHRDERGSGLGATLTEWAVAEARRQGCGLIQLTSDITRTDAHRFYERLGFEKSHHGFKMAL